MLSLRALLVVFVVLLVAPPALAKEYGITAVFAGHDHFYERSMRGGVCYIVAAGG